MATIKSFEAPTISLIKDFLTDFISVAAIKVFYNFNFGAPAVAHYIWNCFMFGFQGLFGT